MAGERNITVVGVQAQFDHPQHCNCESCGPVYALFLSEYEAACLLDALERRDGSDTGDWHAQLRSKLIQAIGRENLEKTMKYFGRTWI